LRSDNQNEERKRVERLFTREVSRLFVRQRIYDREGINRRNRSRRQAAQNPKRETRKHGGKTLTRRAARSGTVARKSGIKRVLASELYQGGAVQDTGGKVRKEASDTRKV